MKRVREQEKLRCLRLPFLHLLLSTSFGSCIPPSLTRLISYISCSLPFLRHLALMRKILECIIRLGLHGKFLDFQILGYKSDHHSAGESTATTNIVSRYIYCCLLRVLRVLQVLGPLRPLREQQQKIGRLIYVLRP